MKGEEKAVREIALELMKDPKITPVDRRRVSGRIVYDGRARLEDLMKWLGEHGFKFKLTRYPILGTGELKEACLGLFKPPNRVFVNPLACNDPALEKTVLYHELTHYLMNAVRGDLSELSKKDFLGQAFVEGAAEYIASKLGDRIFIEAERVGDDGVYYPTSEDNPYVQGWYMYKTVERALGETGALKIMFDGSPNVLRREFNRVKRATDWLVQLVKKTRTAGRLYLQGIVLKKTRPRLLLQYAPGINEGRLLINGEIWAVRDLREKRSLLYFLGRLFGIIRHPWLEVQCVEKVSEKEGDFAYKVPPMDLLEIRIHKAISTFPFQKQDRKTADLNEKVLAYIVKHRGKISKTKAARELGVTIEQLESSIEELKKMGKLKEKRR